MKAYEIERYDSASSIYYKYRFVSLFNNCKGIWRETEDEAIKGGEKHQVVIDSVYETRLDFVGEGVYE